MGAFRKLGCAFRSCTSKTSVANSVYTPRALSKTSRNENLSSDDTCSILSGGSGGSSSSSAAVEWSSNLQSSNEADTASVVDAASVVVCVDPGAQNSRDADDSPVVAPADTASVVGTASVVVCVDPGAQNSSDTDDLPVGAPASESDEDRGVRELMDLFLPGMPFCGLGGSSTESERRSLCRRLLRKNACSVVPCVPRLKHALNWRAKHDALFSERRFAVAGDYRVIGADLDRRPVLYTCMKNQLLPYSQFRDQQVVTMLHAIDNMPGGAGAAIQICDLHGMRLRMADLNPAPLVEWARSQENYFAGMMLEVIIIDMPRMASYLKEAVWPLMPAGVKQRIKFMSLQQAKEHLETACDAEVAGRIAEVMEQNRDCSISLEERQQTWTRVDHSGTPVPMVAQS